MATGRENVLVTGGYGFVGRHLVNKLMSEAESIIIVDDLSGSDKDSLHVDQCASMTGMFSTSDVISYEEDIRNESVISKIIRENEVTHCVHLAAMTSVNESVRNPHHTLSVNVGGTLSVLQACIMNNVHSFIFASSAAVYGDADKLPITEDTLLKPISPYGASKVAAEALVSAYASSIKNPFCLRFFNIYGCYQRSAYAGVISRFKDRLERRLPLEIHGNGLQSRDFVHIDDVVNAILLAKNYSYIHPFYTINIGTGRAITIQYLAKQMRKLFDAESRDSLIGKPEAGAIVHSYPDLSYARRILNYGPEVTLETGLVKMLLPQVATVD